MVDRTKTKPETQTECYVAHHILAGIIQCSAAPTRKDTRTQFIRDYYKGSGSSAPRSYGEIKDAWRKLKSRGWEIVPAKITLEK